MGTRSKEDTEVVRRKGTHLMGYGIEHAHKLQIRDAVNDIYGASNIEGAFITGSIPAGLARPESDVDIFVCHKDTVDDADEKKRQFVEFYFDFHDQLGREPDPISPGEVLSFTELGRAVLAIRRVEPSATLIERDHFDAICWAGMLVSKRDELIPYSVPLTSLQTISRAVVYRWAESLAPAEVLTEGVGAYSDIDKVLRRTISSPGYYDAH